MAEFLIAGLALSAGLFVPIVLIAIIILLLKMMKNRKK